MKKNNLVIIVMSIINLHQSEVYGCLSRIVSNIGIRRATSGMVVAVMPVMMTQRQSCYKEDDDQKKAIKVATEFLSSYNCAPELPAMFSSHKRIIELQARLSPELCKEAPCEHNVYTLFEQMSKKDLEEFIQSYKNYAALRNIVEIEYLLIKNEKEKVKEEALLFLESCLYEFFVHEHVFCNEERCHGSCLNHVIDIYNSKKE